MVYNVNKPCLLSHGTRPGNVCRGGDLIKPTAHHAVVRTLARILGFYIETVFELVRISNKDGIPAW